MNILIVKLSSLGDVIHSLPALNALRRGYPESHITWVVEAYASDVLQGHPSLNRVLVSGGKGWLRNLFRAGRWKLTWKEIRGFTRALRERRYDLVIDLQGLLKSGLIVGLSRGKRRVGYGRTREMSYLFLNERVSPFHPDRHAIERYLHLIRSIGGMDGPLEYGIRIEEGHRRRIESLLTAHGVSNGDPILLISPFAKWETKLWEPDRFARLCDLLMESRRVQVVFTGTEKERGYIRRITTSMNGRPVDLTGRTGLRELAYLCTRSRLMIATDTGTMHLAAAMGLPVVALFGPTSPSRTGPYGEGHTVIRGETGCSPCFKRQCETRACMRSIKVEDVLERALRYL